MTLKPNPISQKLSMVLLANGLFFSQMPLLVAEDESKYVEQETSGYRTQEFFAVTEKAIEFAFEDGEEESVQSFEKESFDNPSTSASAATADVDQSEEDSSEAHEEEKQAPVKECQLESCEKDECTEIIEFVDYQPWKEGINPGLYCLPGSGCTLSCPTRPTGAELYRDQGRLVHKYRYGSEFSPEEWRTIMLHMRVILPMTACSYRKILSFLQERPYKPQKPAKIEKSPENGKNKDDKSLTAKEDKNQDSAVIAKGEDDKEPAGTKALLASADEGTKKDSSDADKKNSDDTSSLDELIGPLSQESAITSSEPIGGGAWTPKFNSVFTGFMYVDYTSPSGSFFGDFNGNNSFSYAFSPAYLVSYGESILMASRLAVFNFGQNVDLTLPYSYFAYFFNDYCTFVAGRFIIPLGNYNSYYSSWITPFPVNPYGRSYFAPLFPSADIGVEVKGAIPLCLLFRQLKCSTLTYDFWLGNGPSEVNSNSPNANSVPAGTIYINGPNSPNNKNSFAWGGRLGLLPTDNQIYGFSYMRGRWSSNKVAFGKFGAAGGRKFNYEAAAFDWTVNFNQYLSSAGEYIWSQYENSLPEFPWVRQSACWGMATLQLGALKCICPSLYSRYPCFWDSLDFSVRYSAAFTQPSGQSFWTGANAEGKAFQQRAFSFAFAYNFTQSFSVKMEYDINNGDDGIDPVRAFATDNFTKETGFDVNVFTLRIVYAW